MKNQQIHQQEKKITDLEKVVGSNKLTQTTKPENNTHTDTPAGGVPGCMFRSMCLRFDSSVVPIVYERANIALPFSPIGAPSKRSKYQAPSAEVCDVSRVTSRREKRMKYRAFPLPLFEQAQKNVFLEERVQVLQQQNEDLLAQIQMNLTISRYVSGTVSVSVPENRCATQATFLFVVFPPPAGSCRRRTPTCTSRWRRRARRRRG